MTKHYWLRYEREREREGGGGRELAYNVLVGAAVGEQGLPEVGKCEQIKVMKEYEISEEFNRI